MKDIVIYGASFSNIIKLIDAINAEKKHYNIIGFFDDEKFEEESSFMEYPIVGNKNNIGKYSNYYFVNNVASSFHARKKVAEIIGNNKLTNIIHPKIDLRYVSVGEGVIIHEGVLLGTNIQIGNNVVIRWAANITHDNHLGDFTFIGPNSTLCGYVTTDYGSYIGASSVIKQGINLGTESVVGLGAVVVKDVDPFSTVVGNPAREIRKK